MPPPLRGVRLCALDIGLMQAGASMKGEFEQRLRSVIDEVQASPTPIILFIDEAHTLIGAGGSAGTGDAANLLKPALARGTLRTIAATTWSEYRQYIEKDPALTRRFQPIQIDEPDVAQLLRHAARHSRSDGKAPQGAHFRCCHRRRRESLASLYSGASIAGQGGEPARHGRARVAISQSAMPAMIEDATAAIAARETEKAALVTDSDLGAQDRSASPRSTPRSRH